MAKYEALVRVTTYYQTFVEAKTPEDAYNEVYEMPVEDMTYDGEDVDVEVERTLD